jgi:hypothetical protein
MCAGVRVGVALAAAHGARQSRRAPVLTAVACVCGVLRWCLQERQPHEVEVLHTVSADSQQWGRKRSRRVFLLAPNPVCSLCCVQG